MAMHEQTFALLLTHDRTPNACPLVQYIQPQHHAKLSQAELLVIDEVGGWVGGWNRWLRDYAVWLPVHPAPPQTEHLAPPTHPLALAGSRHPPASGALHAGSLPRVPLLHRQRL